MEVCTVELYHQKPFTIPVNQLHEMIGSLMAEDEMYHMADNLPKWMMVDIMKWCGVPSFNKEVVGCCIDNLIRLAAGDTKIVFNKNGEFVIHDDKPDPLDEKIEEVLEVICSQRFHIFMKSDGLLSEYFAVGGDPEGIDLKVHDEVKGMFKHIFKAEG